MSRTFDLSRSLLGLNRDGTASVVPWKSGPPPRIDGFVIGAPFMTRNAPHAGEMHPTPTRFFFSSQGTLTSYSRKMELKTSLRSAPGKQS
jgi:hypothetical protein